MMKNAFEKYMFWILVLITALLLSSFFVFGSFDLNKTIGWGWDTTHLMWLGIWSTFSDLFLFTLGYLMLLLSGRLANARLSVIHIALIIAGFVFKHYLAYTILDVVISLASWIVFFKNIIEASRKQGV